MLFRQITPSVYEIPLGHVNAFLINHDELTLIDTGLEGNAHKLMRTIEQIGRTASDIRHIIVTHCHSDHTGSLAAIQKACNATTYMHPIDAALVRQGNAMRPVSPAPGLINKALYRTLVANAPKQITPAQIDREVEDGTTLEIAGGIEAIHTPGHCAGQLALFWPQEGGVLFAADTASNMVRLQPSIVYEDYEIGLRSLRKLTVHHFEVACFGHGKAIKQHAVHQFRQKWLR